MKRIWHDYRRWEDYKAGMWRSATKEDVEKLLPVAIEFTGDHIRYGKAMMRVIVSWKYSCEHNLTDKSLNKRAWIGHAACALEMKLPESIVRMAWKDLTHEQRFEANKQADIAINEWIKNHANKQSGQLEIPYEK
jgi:hypothetical protein